MSNLIKHTWQTLAILGIITATYLTVGIPTDFMSSMWWVVNLVGIVFVLAAAFKHKTTQLLSSIFVIVFGIVCWQSQIYANAVVNLLLLLPISLVGILIWNGTLKWSTKIETGLLLIGNFAIYLIAFATLLVFDVGQHHVLDALSASMIIVATILLALQDKRCWYWWVSLNTLEVIMWFMIASTNQDAIGLLILRVVFLVNSIFGFIEWNVKKSK